MKKISILYVTALLTLAANGRVLKSVESWGDNEDFSGNYSPGTDEDGAYDNGGALEYQSPLSSSNSMEDNDGMSLGQGDDGADYQDLSAEEPQSDSSYNDYNEYKAEDVSGDGNNYGFGAGEYDASDVDPLNLPQEDSAVVGQDWQNFSVADNDGAGLGVGVDEDTPAIEDDYSYASQPQDSSNYLSDYQGKNDFDGQQLSTDSALDDDFSQPDVFGNGELGNDDLTAQDSSFDVDKYNGSDDVMQESDFDNNYSEDDKA